MESEIKAAWKQGFLAALKQFSEVDEKICEVIAEEAWSQQTPRGRVEQLSLGDWNTQRVQHRDEG